MQKVLIIFGTRPEAVKMIPVIKEFKKYNNLFETKVCITAQHREMLDQVISFFNVKVDYDLDLMKPNQNLHELTANIIINIRSVLEEFKPNYVFVHGDTTTTLSSALASFYNQSIVCHVEAGLRTFNKKSPFPEEINRQIVTRIADYHFAPTEISKNNLINEKIDNKKIIVTGNTVIDGLFLGLKMLKKNKNSPSTLIDNLKKKINGKKVILVTGHRRENHGKGIENICRALKSISNYFNDYVIVYPVHLNPKIQKPVNKILSNSSKILLIQPLSYQDFIWLMNLSKLIITDSGGVQEEAPSLGKPVLVTRDNTERPEAIEKGTAKLVGTNEELIFSECKKLIEDVEYYDKVSNLDNPYGDGQASIRIVEFIKNLNNDL